MNKQDVNQKSTIAGWQAALDAERLQIAARILPIAIGVGAVFVTVYTLAYFGLGRPWQWAWATLSTYTSTLLFILAYVVARRGHLPIAVYLMALALNTQALVQPALLQGMTVLGVSTGFLAMIFARLLAGRAENRVVVFISGAAIVTGLLLSGLRVFDLLPQSSVLQMGPSIMSIVAAVVMTALVLDSRDAQYEDSLSQAKAYATELDAQRTVLEERTQDLTRRTRHLEATAEVARDATSVLDLQDLLSQVVTLVSEQFGFYHTGIFLLDPTSEWVVLQAASSEGGRRMLARGHRLKVGEVGIVGYVTGRGEPRIALDVGEDAVFFDNPDLPDTRSEMALPLRARGEIIGALDVQSTEPEAFSDEDVAVLQTLADQVATAISNARLFQQAQESLKAERRAYGELSRQAWAETVRVRPSLGYRYDQGGVASLAEHLTSQGKRRADGGEQRSELVEELPELALPVRVRGQVIGTINAHKPGDAGEWTAEEAALMETLTEQLGVALESARLYQDTQRRAARERLTREITDKMRSVTGVEDIIQTAVDELSRVLGTSRTFVRLGVAPPLRTEASALSSAEAPQGEASQDDRKNES